MALLDRYLAIKDKVVGLTDGLMWGYVVGSGGVVAQGMSKTTSVTLNAVCGQVTMHDASLASGASVTFTLTNALIAATDAVVLNVQGGGTADAYAAFVVAVAAGSCHIRVTNLTGGSLAESPVLNFTVIKAAAA